MSPIVQENHKRSRFEMDFGDDIAFIDYADAGTHFILMHTEVPQKYRREGMGGKLVQGALALVRERGLKVVPKCPFIVNYIAKHPEEQDLLLQTG